MPTLGQSRRRSEASPQDHHKLRPLRLSNRRLHPLPPTLPRRQSRKIDPPRRLTPLYPCRWRQGPPIPAAGWPQHGLELRYPAGPLNHHKRRLSSRRPHPLPPALPRRQSRKIDPPRRLIPPYPYRWRQGPPIPAMGRFRCGPKLRYPAGPLNHHKQRLSSRRHLPLPPTLRRR